jgi:hypothetical protein
MTAQLIQAHYVIASSSELAVIFAERIAAGAMKPMATSPATLFRLLDCHPGGFLFQPRPFLVYTGLAQPKSKLLERPTGEKPCAAQLGD